MIDILLLATCTILLALITRDKSIVKKICNSVLFVLFASIVFFATDNPTISNWATNLIGAESHQILKDALTNTQNVSYAANTVWIFYKAYLIIAVIFSGCIIFVNSIKKFPILRFMNLTKLLSIKSEKLNDCDCKQKEAKIFLSFERMLN